jgi:hypothetical protein
MIRPPTKRPCDTSTQAQLTQGPPISGPCSLGAAQAVDGAPLQHDNHAETIKKSEQTGGHNVDGRKIKTLKICIPTCFASSPWRPHTEDKRMALEHTHGLFIT